MTEEVEDDQLVVDNYCVSFIDLLGQRAALEGEGWLPHFQSDDERKTFVATKLKDSIGVILALQKQANNLIQPLLEERADSPLREKLDPEQQEIWDHINKTKISTQRWSDGIVSFSHIGDTGMHCHMNALFGIFGLAGGLCFLGLSQGHPVRGAIDAAWGVELHEGELYGAAVARAYELESEVAQYPRIVIGDRIIALLESFRTSPKTDIYAEQNREMANLCLRMLLRDVDGSWMLHYLGEVFCQSFTEKLHMELYNDARKYISEQLRHHQSTGNKKLGFRYSHLVRYFEVYQPVERKNLLLNTCLKRAIQPDIRQRPDLVSEMPRHESERSSEFPIHAPPNAAHQGTPIPWSRRHNYKISIGMVGPLGLEPLATGFVISRIASGHIGMPDSWSASERAVDEQISPPAFT